MRAVVRKTDRRAKQGKPSTVIIRNRVVNDDIVSYWKRKGIAIDDVIAQRTASVTPEAVNCYTPLVSPLRTPELLVIPECILNCIRNYFQGSIEDGEWMPRGHGRLNRARKVIAKRNLYSLCNDFSDASSLFSRKRNSEGRKLLSSVMSKLDAILLREHPLTLVYIFRLVLEMSKMNRQELASAALNQFADLGKILIGAQYSLCRISE